MLLHPGGPQDLAWFHSLRNNIRDFILYRMEEINIAKIIQSLKNKQANKNNRSCLGKKGDKYPESYTISSQMSSFQQKIMRHARDRKM